MYCQTGSPTSAKRFHRTTNHVFFFDDLAHRGHFELESEGELGERAQEIFKKICNLITQAILSEDAEISTADTSDFYLGTPLDRKEYMRISLKHIPLDIQQRYNIACMVHNDYIQGS